MITRYFQRHVGELHNAGIATDLPQPSQLFVPFGSGALKDLVSGKITSSANLRTALGKAGPYAHVANNQSVDFNHVGTSDVDTAPVSCVAWICGSGTGDGTLSIFRSAAGSPVAISFTGSNVVVTVRDGAAAVVLSSTVVDATGHWIAAVGVRLSDTDGQDIVIDGTIAAQSNTSASWAGVSSIIYLKPE